MGRFVFELVWLAIGFIFSGYFFRVERKILIACYHLNFIGINLKQEYILRIVDDKMVD